MTIKKIKKKSDSLSCLNQIEWIIKDNSFPFVLFPFVDFFPFPQFEPNGPLDFIMRIATVLHSNVQF